MLNYKKDQMMDNVTLRTLKNLRKKEKKIQQSNAATTNTIPSEDNKQEVVVKNESSIDANDSNVTSTQETLTNTYEVEEKVEVSQDMTEQVIENRQGGIESTIQEEKGEPTDRAIDGSNKEAPAKNDDPTTSSISPTFHKKSTLEALL